MIPTCVRIVLIVSGSVTQDEFNSVLAIFPVQLQWGECGPAGSIFHATYFRWFDAATWSMFARVGFPAARLRAEHRSMPLVQAECRIQGIAEQQDRCEVRSRIARWGGKSFVVAHDVLREDGTPLAQGSETRVWGRHENGPGTPIKGQPISEDMKALFRGR
jgi:4-hydroxybenzoyl-CoA thioesterase